MRGYLFLIFALSLRINAAAQPNIVLIYADDLGFGELGSYGQKIIRTPFLDQIASEGLRFTNFYSSSALCAPARCQMLTGLHSGHAQIRANFEMANGPDSFTDLNEKGQMPLAVDAVTIAKRLKEAGYATACIGKWGMGMADSPGNPNQHGFDYFYGYLDQKQAHNYYPTHLWENGTSVGLPNPFMRVHTKVNAESATDSLFKSFIGNSYSIDAMAEKVRAFISSHKKDRFFLYYPITLPHLALQAPESAVREYLGKFEEQPYYGDQGYCPSKYPRSTYAAMVTYMDKKVGELLDQLKQNGLENNTLVIFTSDNGSAFKTGGTDPDFFAVNGKLRSHKGSLYEGGIRVPFIIQWPGIVKPGIVDQPWVGYDIFPTLLDAAGLKKNSGLDGLSFFNLLRGNKSKVHKFLYFELSEYSGQQALRFGDWKAIRRNMNKDPNSAWELYNLKNDPSEVDNLAWRFPKKIKKLAALAAKQHARSPVDQWNFMEKAPNNP